VSAAPTARDAFRRGVRELLPAGPGVFAWGLVTGVAMVKSGLTVTQAVGLTLLTNHPDYPQRIAYYLGGATANWIIWQVASLLGIFGADVIPTDWGLELAGTLALIALVVPLCARRPALAGVVVAGTIAVAARDLPLRLGRLLAGRRLVIPARVESALRYAPACALAAIIATDLLVTDGAPHAGMGNPKLFAGMAAMAIFALTRSTIGIIVGGMAAFWLLKFGLPG